jgi:hypothetical protein
MSIRKTEKLKMDAKISVQDYLSGKMSIIWIFSIKSPLPQ